MSKQDWPIYRPGFYSGIGGRGLTESQRLTLDRVFDSYGIFLPEEEGERQALIESFLQAITGEVWFEIGCGMGEHICGRALKNPDVTLIGVEPFTGGLASAARKIDKDNIQNIRLLRQDAHLLLSALPENFLTKIFLLFPDPWPKARHHKRRFLNQDNLDLFHSVLKPEGQLILATDHDDYRAWTNDHMSVREDFELLTQDVWETPEKRPDGWIPTKFEEKSFQKQHVCTRWIYKAIS